ncbi:LysE family translocator [Consotaella aegiceratis]|uniref:LysE family translocator n=1 Tax=Consotaella aegiceratis TaxID=3097961 RepID=UPI002F4268C3
MTADALLGVFLFALAVSMTPGPNNVMLMTSGVNFGFVRTVPHMAGIVAGFAMMMLAVGLGLGALLHTMPTLALALKIAAGLYMLYLAWRIAFSGAIGEADQMARPLTFWQAAAFQWINPKAIGAGLAVTAAHADVLHPLASAVSIAGVFAVISCLSVTTWTGFGLAVRRFLSNPGRLRIFNAVMGLLLVATILPMLR